MVVEPMSSTTAPRKLPNLKRRYEDYGKVDILAKNYNPVDEHLFGGKPLREEFKRDMQPIAVESTRQSFNQMDSLMFDSPRERKGSEFN